MPFYAYRCSVCKEVFEVRHGMFFIQERCIKCHSTECLTKIPTFEISGKEQLPPEQSAPGSLVKKHIEESRTELKEEKKKLKKQEL